MLLSKADKSSVFVNLLVLFNSIFKLSKNWAIDKYLSKSIDTLDLFWLIANVKILLIDLNLLQHLYLSLIFL